MFRAITNFFKKCTRAASNFFSAIIDSLMSVFSRPKKKDITIVDIEQLVFQEVRLGPKLGLNSKKSVSEILALQWLLDNLASHQGYDILSKIVDSINRQQFRNDEQIRNVFYSALSTVLLSIFNFDHYTTSVFFQERYKGKKGTNAFDALYSFIEEPKYRITECTKAQINVMVYFFDPVKKISNVEKEEISQNIQTQITDRINRGASQPTLREILTSIYNQILSYYNQPAAQPKVQQNAFTPSYARQTALESETEPNFEHQEFNASSFRRSPVQF